MRAEAGADGRKRAKVRRIVHECPRCSAEVITHVPAQVLHYCPQSGKRDLVGFVIRERTP